MMLMMLMPLMPHGGSNIAATMAAYESLRLYFIADYAADACRQDA